MGTLFLCHLMETGPQFYMVIRARRRSSHLQCKGVPSFLSCFKTPSNGPAPGIKPMTSHSAIKCSSTELILPRLILLVITKISTKLVSFVFLFLKITLFTVQLQVTQTLVVGHNINVQLGKQCTTHRK